jgi:hypothetical protein
VNKPTCHPDRRLYAKGRCNSCYRKWRLTQKKERATCHPDRPHVAKGLCRNCYKALCDKRLPKERLSARWRKADLKHTFGLTPEQVAEMRQRQGDKCGMCGQPFGADRMTRPHVDHCHTTGQIRGLLCFRCNTSLGAYEKYRALAEAYLSRWPDARREAA